MTILVSSNERQEIKEALGELGFDANLPFDFLIFTLRGSIGAERKFFPDDMMSSARDGRLAKELAAIREACQYGVLIAEGEAKYTTEGKLRIGNRPSAWTRAGVRNLFRSIRYVEGVDVEYSANILDTVEVLKELQRYFDTDVHVSLRTRPKFESSWYLPVYEERLIHFYQGLPGISIILARKLAERFPSPMSLFSAAKEELMEVGKFGQLRAGKIIQFLHEGKI